MKKIFTILLLISLILTACAPAPGEPLNEASVVIDSASALSAQVGFTVTQPTDTRNHSFELINDVIAQMTFSYQGLVFTFRGSKIYSGQSLYGMYDNFESEETVLLTDETEAVFSVFKDGAAIITWFDSGVYKSLYCQKNVDQSYFISLCDQL